MSVVADTAGASAVDGPAAPGDPATAGWASTAPVVHPAPPEGRVGRFFRTLVTRPAWLAPAALLACFAMSVMYVEKFDPTTGQVGPTGGCVFKALTGLDCPGCGGTRAFFYLIHGNVPEAARNHLLAVFAAPFVVYMYIAWSINRIFHTKLPMLRVSPVVVSIFLGGWLVFAVVRNLPWAPFTYLQV